MSKPIILNVNNNKKINRTKFEYEKDIQKIVENNMDKLFSCTFLETEYSFWDNEGNGRIDSIAIDSEFRPTIFEYKLKKSENVVNQALYYLDWLDSHRKDFEMLVLKKMGESYLKDIDWSNPKAICIAEDFNKYDMRAVKKMGVDIVMIEYALYDSGILTFNIVNKINDDYDKKIAFFDNNQNLDTNLNDINVVENNNSNQEDFNNSENKINHFLDQYQSYDDEFKKLVQYITNEILNIDDGIDFKDTRVYRSFFKFNSFASLVLKKKTIYIYLKIPYEEKYNSLNKINDVSNKGRWATGDVELLIKNEEDFNDMLDIIKESYVKNN